MSPPGRRLGFAVKVLGGGGLPSHDTRRWQSAPHLDRSLDRLEAIFERLASDDVRMYRMSSDLVPYGSHPELTRFHGQVERCAERLAALGERARTAGLRLSFHPGQYVVLNSEDADVRRAAARDLELAASVLDAMGLGPEAVVVLHVGGAAGGTAAALDRFLAGAEQLSAAARARLVVENDDRRFGLRDVLALSERSGLRVVWDVHHHRCHDPDGIPEAEALALALATWRDSGAVPKIHWSSPRTAVEERSRRVGRRVERTLVLPPLRAHADLVDPIAFAQFLTGPGADGDYDVMLEAKAKDVALLRLRDQLAERGFGWADGRLLAPAGR
ncbi:UV DNA damage repair endonuclease UvsE [Conexibacter arvalis]|uniref:UV DNA damage endonuclease n=1 Tax=Conexibacter arvalis TaxID=912552 RepID=A0A840I9V5_9ACTN|nr:UV DNA damage repair endonuclease UvsE [Conexibacter arvalis]MBB4660710.1 UV DNA damage endonuclease [Conexibacter arvalis]